MILKKIRSITPGIYQILRNSYRNFLFKITSSKSKFQNLLSQCQTNEEVFMLTQKIIPSAQVKSEILALIDFLNINAPSSYLEIGLSTGGTHFLIRYLCPSIKNSIGIDIDIQNTHIIDTLTQTSSFHYLQGRSDSQETLKSLGILLKPNTLDILFIDGDHSFEGVKRDFEYYSRFVRDGGFIVFHDIVADHNQRWGKPTDKWSGGVPDFFREISKKYLSHEFVEDQNQDGYGIGVIIYNSQINTN
ncbi:class I SAM-dependent methyltransferase [Nodularia chucula]|uniref:class I SAM-dependent methyltransferase n=1 Tax=Nodularia chucula TaxID=3093667 RepID=UPI0039C6E979